MEILKDETATVVSSALTVKMESLPDWTGTWRKEYTHGWYKTSAISFKCSRIYGGFVIPIRSIVLPSRGSSATIAFNRIGRFTPMSRPEEFFRASEQFFCASKVQGQHLIPCVQWFTNGTSEEWLFWFLFQMLIAFMFQLEINHSCFFFSTEIKILDMEYD